MTAGKILIVVRGEYVEKEPVSVSVLCKEITIEILRAFNLPDGEFGQWAFGGWFKKPATRFSEIFAQFDHDVADFGLSEAAKRLLLNFTEPATAVGAELIPAEGPVLITSNHPGTVDGVSIVASMPRNDVKVIVGGMPFLKKLPIASGHTIVAERTSNNVVRGNVVRESIRHLKNGGALLIFPSGRIDPDPAVLPGAVEALEYWSRSIAIMLRRVPETLLVPTITSGVLAERYTRSPLTMLKSDGVGKRRIMEMIQIMRQLVFGEHLSLRPLITFDRPFTVKDLGITNLRETEQILHSVIERAKNLLNEHIAYLPEHLDVGRSQYA
ncbi:MAG TPA: 1-acyl-sn-glycerol-3-phosphate acyltransferase [Anaerolineales bacterium]|nr:1-acyl-sn-glycerol-3-phosphate acyltransferase [Anaerolineales bacterium]